MKPIPERQDVLDKFIEKYFPEPKTAQTNGHAKPVGARPTDDEVIEKCRGAENAAKFADLFDHGDVYAYHDGDPSRADLALLGILAFWTQDEKQLERLFSSSALGRRGKWRNRRDYRTRTIRKALADVTKTYAWGASSHSHPLRDHEYYDDASGTGEMLELVSLASVPRPEDERQVVIEGMIPRRFPSIFYGDGGTAKSLLAASMLLAVAGEASEWMGHAVRQHGPVIYLDFELDREEQARRVYQLSEGAGMDRPPERFYYLSGADRPLKTVLNYTLDRAKGLGAAVVLLDSLGFAVEGDMEASRDVLRFVRDCIKPFERAGVTLVIVDHQSKLTAGEGYHQKSPFGSVYKSNACRSVLQVGVEDQREGELTVRFRHQKANFGSKLDPFEAHLVFHDTKVEITHRALGAEDLASEGSLNTRQKIRRLLEAGPMYPCEAVEKIQGVTEGTVKNALSAMRKRGEIEDTGVISDTGAHQVRLTGSSSHSHPYRERDYDDGAEGAVGEGF
jgi:AAA domain-containing protein/primase/DNA polymerase family protein